MMTTEQAAGQLEDLARTDPVVARLASVQAVALRASGDPAWQEGIPDLDASQPSPGVPVLDGQILRVDPVRARELLGRLTDVAVRTGVADAEPLARGIRTGVVDPLRLLQAGLAQDPEPLMAAATELEAESSLLQLFAQLLAVPLLQAGRLKAAAPLADAPWDAGYCAVCGAWPVLAESRGLARERWLRCGGCGAGWRFAHHRCVFCGNADHRTQQYLAAESERETRRAEVCQRCRGYLKTVSTLAELGPAELAAQDMTSLELDMAALDGGYSRPATPGYRMEVQVEPLPRAARSPWMRLRWPTR